MREIKFRVWDKELEETLTQEEGSFQYRDREDYWITDLEDAIEYSERFVVMQYTGLKDKNGVEIYDEDIVRFTNSIDEIDNEVGKVIWEQSECNFVVQYKTANCVTQEENGTTITIYLISNETYRECVEYEVIGNIYENPELLEREN